MAELSAVSAVPLRRMSPYSDYCACRTIVVDRSDLRVTLLIVTMRFALCQFAFWAFRVYPFCQLSHVSILQRTPAGFCAVVEKRGKKTRARISCPYPYLCISESLLAVRPVQPPQPVRRNAPRQFRLMALACLSPRLVQSASRSPVPAAPVSGSTPAGACRFRCE